jgi:hypothetical protein
MRAALTLLLSTGCAVTHQYRGAVKASVPDDAPVDIKPAPILFAVSKWPNGLRVGSSSTGFGFVMVNRTTSPIAVDWDACAVVLENGESLRAIHKAVKYEDNGRPQAPSTVSARGKMTDYLLPTEFVYQGVQGQRQVLSFIEPSVGPHNDRFSLLFALRIEGKPVNLTVPITVTSVERTDPKLIYEQAPEEQQEQTPQRDDRRAARKP